MAYFPDLSSYSYRPGEESALNVGWLEVQHVFSTGAVNEVFCQKLLHLCCHPVKRTRGYHVCPFCATPAMGQEVRLRGESFKLGDAQIRVRGLNGEVYASPNLIYHYVQAHHYRPPQAFIDAVARAEV